MPQLAFHRITMLSSLLLYSVFILTVQSVVQDDSDKILSLPGQPSNLSFDQYAGYITVNATNGRKLFYWLVEATVDADTKPLILWQTGGPGCSSLLALLTENGPFYPSPDGNTLYSSPYSWNMLANVLYVESPAGVGFSSSKVESDYTVGDDRTAEDLIQFLTFFLAKYPKFMQVPFYLAGESYGGHYVPNLALLITKVNLIVKFKGFLLGNPWTYPMFDNNGSSLFWFTHGLMTVEQFEAINLYCDFSRSGPFLHYPDVGNKQCLAEIEIVDKVLAYINPYDIYGDLCMREKFFEGTRLHQLMSGKLHSQERATDNPCVVKDTYAYLNRPDVQKAIHADEKEWTMCSNQLHYSEKDLLTPMKNVWTQLLGFSKELKFLVYSGDVDAAVPWLGTLFWLKDLERDGIIQLTKDWNPWYATTRQVGGFTLQFDKMTFKTVREAGHQVPLSQPRRAYDMLNDFLE